MIQGWDVAVASMTTGEVSLFTIKPDYAYGKEGSGTKIPPDATLQFEIELVQWKGEDVTRDGQVTKIILEKGEGYEKPNTGAACEGNDTVSFLLLFFFFALYSFIFIALFYATHRSCVTAERPGLDYLLNWQSIS